MRNIFKRLFRTRDDHADVANALYLEVVRRAREPVFYAQMHVPDTLDGRFELIALHAFMLMRRLKQRDNDVDDTAQALFDVMFQDMDRSLREMGVGDLSVGKRVKQMISAFYGRVGAYEAVLDGDEEDLRTALIRNLYGSLRAEPPARSVAALASYVRAQAAALDAMPLDAVLRGGAPFAIMPGAAFATEPRPDDAGVENILS